MGTPTEAPAEPRTPTTYKVFAVNGKDPVALGDFKGFSQTDVKKDAANKLLDGKGPAEVVQQFKDSGKVTLAAVSGSSWKPETIAFEQPSPRIRVGA